MTILQQVEVVVIFRPYIRSIDRYAYCVWLLHKYEAHINTGGKAVRLARPVIEQI